MRGFRRILCSILFGFLFSLPTNVQASELVFVCNENNDLYQVVNDMAVSSVRFDNAEDAVVTLKTSDAILFLADGYPAATTDLSEEVFRQLNQKQVKAYIEFPGTLPGFGFKPVRRAFRERVVVVEDVFGEKLKPMDVLAIHDCHFVETNVDKPLMVLAGVAGYDTAVYGIDDVPSYPILFRHGNLIVSTTKLSQFVTGRYATRESLQAVWQYLFKQLLPERDVPALVWRPLVGPTYGKTEPLAENARLSAIQRGIDWHGRAGMVLNEKGWEDYQKFWDPLTGDALGHDGVGEWPDTTPPYGDGRFGILEGAYSQIDSLGNQKAKKWLRSDSNGESSLAFALRWKLDGDPWSRRVAENVLDWLYFTSGLFQTDLEQANCGLLFWSPDNRQALYQDNDVKAIMGLIGTSAVLETDKWDEVLVRNILGNFRTTGPLGFRGWRLENPDVLQNGWRHYRETPRTNFSPHYEAWMWSTYLWLYDKTGYEPFLEKVKNGVKMMNEAYPERWFWASACSPIDYARMLLVCSWLIRVEDTPEHRRWLKFYADKLAELQDGETGAIREQVIGYPHLQFRIPQSNAEYGTSESGLAAQDGDPVTDQLYSTNFALFGLNEAYHATGDVQYRQMRDRLAEFLIRIQVKSESHPELDGGWFRAFDYEKWEYWGANADAGWGAWSIEVGWTQAWIPTSLALCELETSLWDLSRNSRVNRHFQRVLNEMIPEEKP
ncbi:MAG: hypothetical protein FWC43_12160 [Planctomycetaceae bacterium]|nr:hypothetical protein [Planctomycetaceae bacterium]